MSPSFLQNISIAKITAKAYLILWKLCVQFVDQVLQKYILAYWHQKEELVNILNSIENILGVTRNDNSITIKQ